MACCLVFAAGMSVVWLRSEMVGTPAIERPMIERVQGYVLDREDQPAKDRVRLTMAVRDGQTDESRKIRVNVPLKTANRAVEDWSDEALGEGRLCVCACD